MTNNKTLFAKIDKIIKSINSYAVDPDFSKEISNRNKRKPPKQLTDQKLLEIFTTLIAFSGQAPSDKVKLLIDAKIFNEIFYDFDVAKVASLNPCDLVDKYWEQITPIRCQTKLFQIVMFARRIKRIGSLSSLLTQSKIPISLKSKNDIDEFWKGFDNLQNSLEQFKISYLKETTTLLHYLLDTGYDCAKPDSVVMKVALKIGIVDSDKGDTNFRKTVRTIQEYCVERKLRPSILDLYFLIDEGQKAAKKYVRVDYYN
jgi:3-methyladenine DNA glycosylase Tag